MEKKNGVSGILVVLVFAVVCFLVYYIVANKDKKNHITVEPIVEDNVEAEDTSDVNVINDDSTKKDNDNNQLLNKDNYDYNAGYDLDDDNIRSEIKVIMEKYYTTVDFNIKCGKKDMEDFFIPEDSLFSTDKYYRCLEYNSIDDLKKHYNSFLSENFYSKMLELSFIEHDNKLYCHMHPSASYTYEKGSFDVEVVKKAGESINATGVYKTKEDELYPEYTFDVKMKFSYINNHLVLDKYDDNMRNN